MANDLPGVTLILLWIIIIILNPASAIPASELQALRTLGEALRIDIWNETSDPCTGNWQGIKCCSVTELDSTCCNLIFHNPARSDNFCPVNSSTTVVGINLDSSYSSPVTGFISDSVCNLTSLLTLDLNNNNLTGSIPRCIGSRLTKLKKLGLSGAGTLSGGIPEEIGLLSNLEEIYLDNNNLTGPIPSSIGGMVSLKMMYLRNNHLDGELPQDIGKLKNLSHLCLQVNRLSGTLSPLANLTGLKNFAAFNNRLSGELGLSLLNRGLETLDLRFNKFTGGIPAFDESFNLTSLDLGFNMLSGGIPDSLSRVPALQNLFLGHNNLSGDVPSLTSFNSLRILDISHNMFTGSLPAVPSGLQADFSFNSFNIGQGRTQTYFSCLSTNTSSACNRTRTGKQTLFTVRAGSLNQLQNRDGTTFQKDTVFNQTGMYYLEADGNWAVEVSGQSTDMLDSSQTTVKAPPEDAPELYKTMRWSSSYMAYHGSNLEDGEYNVTLYFCETAFETAGFRVFDVRLQGETIAERLDVVKEVGALTGYKITRNATVRDGLLSIEFIYTGNDRYIDQNKYRVRSTGAMVSAILVKSYNYVSPSSSSSNKWKVTVLAVVGSVAVLLLVLFFTIGKWRKSRKTDLQHTLKSWRWGGHQHAGIRVFRYEELLKATDGFNPSNKLGQGGFGSVYMGRLEDNVLVAVKQLLHQNQQGRDAFRKEIEILSSVQHRNLVAVRGYCLDLVSQPMLICDYMQKGSLDGFLHGDSGFLTWEQRRRIAEETAFGLAYLHDESKHKIIHCDVKPPNILLDDELRPRIADFGMARLYEEGRSHVTATRMGGTIGYLAPEYAMHYQLSDKADVYSFGMVLLEMISGRRAVDSKKPEEQVVLVEYAHRLAFEGKLTALLDKRLSEVKESEVLDVGRVAVLCTLENPVLRPRMRSVWLMLKGNMEIPELPLTVESRFGTVRALLSGYEQNSLVLNSNERLIPLSPR